MSSSFSGVIGPDEVVKIDARVREGVRDNLYVFVITQQLRFASLEFEIMEPIGPSSCGYPRSTQPNFFDRP